MNAKSNKLTKLTLNSRILNSLSILFIILIFCLFYREQIFGSKYVPFDSKDQVYPFVSFTTQSYRSGEIPLWNPYIYSGTPSFADPLYMTFYPGTILYAIPKELSQRWFDIIELLHILFGGVSLFYLMKDYKLHNAAAIAAAIVFMLGGPLTGRIQHVTQIAAISLAPLALLLIRLGIYKQRAWLLGLSGLVLGSSIMVGYQVALLFFMVACFYFIFESFLYRKEHQEKTNKLIIYFVFMVLVTFCFSALQTIPSLEFSRLSNRPSYDYASASAGSVPPQTILTMVFPNLFNSIRGDYWGPIDVTEGYLYIGFIPLCFLIYSLVNWKHVNAYQKFFLCVAFFSLLYALGRYTPFHRFIFKVIPPLRLFRRPSDALFIFHLCIVMGFGFAFDLWIKSVHTLSQRIQHIEIFHLLYGGLILIAFFIVHRNRPELSFFDWFFLPNAFFIILSLFIILIKPEKLTSALLICLIAIISFDIIITSSDRWFNSTSQEYVNIDRESIYGCSEVVEFLRNNLGDEYRFESAHAGSLWTNSAALWQIPSSTGCSPLVVGSYDQFASPTETWALRHFSGFINSYSSNLFDLLGVKYIITASEIKDIDPEIDMHDFPKVKSTCYNIYENKGVLPLAFIVHEAIILENYPYNDLGLYQNYEPDKTVILENIHNELENKLTTVDDSIHIGQDTSFDNLNIVKKSNNGIFIEAELESDGILLLNDVYYPGWKVTVDGEPSLLLKTNYTFKGVYLSSGKHLVEFKFLPKSFILGSILILLSLIGVILSITIKKDF